MPRIRVRTPRQSFTATAANGYDEAWRDAWVANVGTVLATPNGYTKTTGKAVHFGDSMSVSRAYGHWAGGQGAVGWSAPGATASDLTTIAWTHWSEYGNDDGFYLAGGIALTAQGGGGWSDAWIATALDDARVTAAQFAFWRFNNPNGPGTPDLTIVQTRIDQSIARGMLPILVSVPPRWAAALPSYDNDYTIPYNAALKALAATNSLPYVGLYEEIVKRRPNAAGNITPGAWYGTIIDAGDGVHLGLASGYSVGADPYSPGGSAATETTGDQLLNSGYDLVTWLVVQKMKQIKTLAGL